MVTMTTKETTQEELDAETAQTEVVEDAPEVEESAEG